MRYQTREPPSREEIRKLIISGYKSMDLAKHFKCNRNLLNRWLTSYHLPLRRIDFGTLLHNGLDDESSG